MFISIFSIIFETIKLNWTDTPFQKVILAPLSEETLKLSIAFFILLAIYILLSRSYKKNLKKPKKEINFFNGFKYGYVYLAAIFGWYFGYMEFRFQGGINSPLLHFSIDQHPFLPHIT